VGGGHAGERLTAARMEDAERVRASKKAAEREGVEEDGRTETWPFLPLPTTRAVATTSSRGSAS